MLARAGGGSWLETCLGTNPGAGLGVRLDPKKEASLWPVATASRLPGGSGPGANIHAMAAAACPQSAYPPASHPAMLIKHEPGLIGSRSF
jgi:hypothetical protein